MAKANFTKVEEALAEGLRKMTIENLGEMADKAKADRTGKPSDDKLTEKKQALILASLKQDLKWLYKKDRTFYKKLEMTKKSVNELIDNPMDWDKIKELKIKVEKCKQEMLVEGKESNEQLVEQERSKHINKRFNINDKWLPLQ